MKYETIVCPFCGNGHAHITYEENRVYQMNCPDCHNAIFHRDTSWDNAVSFFKRMVVTDESALRQQEHFREVTKKVEPLTLDELREMDGEPVWIVEEPDWGHWELSADADDYVADREPSFYGMKHNDPAGRYGLHKLGWLAYRQKPEENTK